MVELPIGMLRICQQAPRYLHGDRRGSVMVFRAPRWFACERSDSPGPAWPAHASGFCTMIESRFSLRCPPKMATSHVLPFPQLCNGSWVELACHKWTSNSHSSWHDAQGTPKITRRPYFDVRIIMKLNASPQVTRIHGTQAKLQPEAEQRSTLGVVPCIVRSWTSHPLRSMFLPCMHLKLLPPIIHSDIRSCGWRGNLPTLH